MKLVWVVLGLAGITTSAAALVAAETAIVTAVAAAVLLARMETAALAVAANPTLA
jgi:hypothetical protein